MFVGLFSLLNLQGRVVPGLFQLLVVARSPWLVAASLQSLPLSSHGCLPPVTVSARGLLCVCVCMLSHSVVSDSMQVPIGCVASLVAQRVKCLPAMQET